MGRVALILVMTSLALPVAAHAGAVDRTASEKLCRSKERAAAAIEIRPQARKPSSHPSEKRYILM